MFDIIGLISKFIPDTKAAKKLEAQIKTAHSKALTAAVEADKEVRLEELRVGGFAALWRPTAAIMTYMCIFLYNFIYPALFIIRGVFDLDFILPELPELPLEFYGLAIAFISIYAHGRSMEKRR